MKAPVVVISQPRYLPCLQYLRRIAKADIFIVLDNVQRTERQFENRNRMVCDGQPKWLTIPVKGSRGQLINEAEISERGWNGKHLNKLLQWYPLDRSKEIMLKALYASMGDNDSYLDTLMEGLRFMLRRYLVSTEVVMASSIQQNMVDGKEQLMHLCKQVNAGTYLAGPACVDYGLDHAFAASHNIELIIDDWSPGYYKNWKGYLPAMHFDLTIGAEDVRHLVHRPIGE